jgi:hypothetical protein
MSSPTDRTYDPDDPSPYAPRWVRDAAHPPRRTPLSELGRRALAAEDGLRATSPMSRNRDQAAPPLAASHPDGREEELVIDNFRVPHALDPGSVPEPWPAPRSRLRSGVTGMMGRLALAGGIAALGALIAIGKLSLPGASGASGQSDPVPAFGSRFGGLPSKAQDRAVTAEQPNEPRQVAMVQPTVTPPSAPAAQPVVANAPPASVPAPAPAALPPTPALTAAPIAAAAPGPAPAPAPATPALDPDSEEVLALVKRGEQIAASGDIAAARLILRRAADAHNARAALALAATYDPIVLEKIGVFGVTPDIAAARSWYEKAREFGSTEAPRRLELLASRGQ